MPILDLQRDSAFPEIGRIRKGEPKTQAGYAGKSLGEIFRFTANDENDTALEQKFAEVYGAQPKELDAYFAYASAEKTFTAWMEEYTQTGIQKQCDSEHIRLQRQPDGGLMNYKSINSSMAPVCTKKTEGICGCKSVGRLHLLMPKLERWGIITLMTGSVNDIINFYKVIGGLEEAIHGRQIELNQIPLRITRYFQDITVSKPEGARKYNVSLIRIEPHPDWISRIYSNITVGPVTETRKIERPTPTPKPLASAPQEETADVVQYGNEYYVETDEALHDQAVQPNPLENQRFELQTKTRNFGLAGERDGQGRLLWSLCLSKNVAAIEELTGDELEIVGMAIENIIVLIPDQSSRMEFFEYVVDAVKNKRIDTGNFMMIPVCKNWIETIQRVENTPIDEANVF